MPSLENLGPFATHIATVIIPGILGAIFFLVVGNWALRQFVRLAALTAARAGVKTALVDLLKATITTVGWIFIAAGILQSLGLSELAIALGGSITLVAFGVSTAASGNLGDIIAGVFLASDPDFGTGYVITVTNATKELQITGVIERIDLRKTRIRTADNRLHIVPNKQIEANIWVVEGVPKYAQPERPKRSLFAPKAAPSGTSDAQPEA